MSFIHPILFGAGLAAVSIPIIIHLLFRQRRKPIPWAAMRFLLEAFRKQRRRLRIEQLLLLITRCLIVAAAALALGRPLLERASLLGGEGGRDVYLLIDTGLASSLRNADSEGTALDAHKELASKTLASLGPGDRAGLISLGDEAKPIVLPASSDIAAVRRLVEALESTDASTDIAGAFRALGSTLASPGEDALDERPAVVILISDFLEGSADLSRPLEGTGIEGLSIVATGPSESSRSNVQVIAAEPLRPVVLTGSGQLVQDAQVRVRLRRTGEGVGESGLSSVRVYVTAGELNRAQVAAQGEVRWTPGQTEADLPLTVRVDRARLAAMSGADDSEETPAVVVVEIDRDALEGDNLFRRPIGVADALDVAIIAPRRFGRAPSVDRLSSADWLRIALKPAESTPIEIVDAEPSNIDASLLARLDAVYLPAPDLVPADAWQRLRAFVDAGGLLIVSPPETADVHLWTDAFTDTFDLDWRFAREPESSSDPIGVPVAPGAAASSILTFVSESEIEQLVSSVRTRKWLPLESITQSDRIILSLETGEPWIVVAAPSDSAERAQAEPAAPATPLRRGSLVYMSSAPVLSWTDLPARPLMVPLLQEIVRQSVGAASAAHMSFAGARPLAPSNAKRLEPLAASGARAPIRVDRAGIALEPARHAGILRAVDEAERQVGLVAINADPQAGRTASQSKQAVANWLGGAASSDDLSVAAPVRWLDAQSPETALESDSASSSISLPLLYAALALALLETLMARWFSHAFREPGEKTSAQEALAA